jgi:P27 family predicted phage terminase small subunit
MPRGRRPKPVATLKLIGTYRKDRHGAAPEAPPLPADCPARLTGDARELWLEYSPKLIACGVATELDRMALETLCLTHADWLDADNKARLYRHSFHGLNDKMRAEAKFWQRAARDKLLALLKLQTEFGMTPASRSRVRAEGGTNRAGGVAMRKRG